MSFIPKPHEIYKHFKGNLYQIVAIAEHSETGEQMVVYQALYGDFKTYVRPLDMFVGYVDKAKYPQVAQEFRFELQGAESDRQKKEMLAEYADAKEVTEIQNIKETEPVTEVENVAETKGVAETEVVVQAASVMEATSLAEEAEELHIDPMVLEFLDADSYEQRLNILAGLHHRITDDMITTMAIACDIEVEEGDTEERYESLKSCLLTLEKYECNRLR